MITFEPIIEEKLNLALDIVNSNTNYNRLENGKPTRTIKEMKDFLNLTTDSWFIKMNDKYIGIIDFLNKNPRDNYPWLGLIMIHSDYHSLGYGTKAYNAFEEKLRNQDISHVRLGVLQTNQMARGFWEKQGFKCYGTSEWEGKKVDCFKKEIEKSKK